MAQTSGQKSSERNKGVDSQMISDRDILTITDNASPSDLHYLYIELNLSNAEIENAELSAPTKDAKVTAVKVLQSWRSINGRLATRRAILDALGRCKRMETVAKLEDIWDLSFQFFEAAPSRSMQDLNPGDVVNIPGGREGPDKVSGRKGIVVKSGNSKEASDTIEVHVDGTQYTLSSQDLHKSDSRDNKNEFGASADKPEGSTEQRASNFKKGDIVRIREMPVDEMKRLQRNHGGWVEYMKMSINCLGKVLHVDSDGDVWVSLQNGPRWALNPQCLEQVERSDVEEEIHTGNFERGQGVRIKKGITVKEMRRLQRDYGGMAPAMEQLIGKPGIVAKVTFSQVVVKMYNGEKWALNCALLEADDEAAKNIPKLRAFKTGDKVRVKTMDIETLKQKQNGYGGLGPFMGKAMGSTGTVQHVRMGRMVAIKMDDTDLRWCFNRSCLEHIDDKPPVDEDGDDDSDDDDDDDEMDELLRKLDKISSIRKEGKEAFRTSIEEALASSDPDFLIHACSTGRTETVEKILRGKPEWINYRVKRGKGGTTPLIMACQEEHLTMVKNILDRGADVDLDNGHGNTALMMAAVVGNQAILQELLQRGAKVNLKNNKGRTALHLAVASKSEDCVQILLDPQYGVDVTIRDENDVSPAELAVVYDNPTIRALMLTSELCDPSVRDKRGFNLLHVASQKGQADAIDLILSKKPELLNEPNDDGSTAVLLASFNNKIEAFKMLLSKEGCDLSVRETERGDTCLHLASVRGNIEVVKILVDGGADVNAQSTKHGATPLFYTLGCLYGVIKMVDVSPNSIISNCYSSSLDYGKLEDIAIYLVQHGANMELADNRGNTPLDILSQYGDENFKQTLIQAANSADEKQGTRHPGIRCDGCSQEPLRGTRYSCSWCLNYNICSNCKERGVHSDCNHQFTEVPKPGTRSSSDEHRTSESTSTENLTLNHLQFVKKLGKGAQGTVWRVAFTGSFQSGFKGHKEAAVKIVNEDEIATNEITKLKQLDHPNIVALLSVIGPIRETNPPFEGRCYIVMERGDQSLFEYMGNHSKHLVTATKFKWGLSITDAVNYLHSNNVVHRDLKPQNCILFNDTILKLCDFGISREAASTKTTYVGHGTFFYMPPEIEDENPAIKEKKKTFSPKSDVYQIGCVLWELFGRMSLPKPPYVLIPPMTKDHLPIQAMLVECFSNDPKDRPDISTLHNSLGKLRRAYAHAIFFYVL